MKSLVLSNNRDTIVGMRLAGVEGKIVKERQQILEEIHEACNDKNIGMIIITPEVFNKVEDKILKIKTKRLYPIIVKIPNNNSNEDIGDHIIKHIRESIGIKV